MKKICLILLLHCCTFYSHAQLLTTAPDFIQETSSSIDIVADATKGNAGIKDYVNTTDIYVHIGCITSLSTSSSDWKYSKFTWGTTNVLAQCTYLSLIHI